MPASRETSLKTKSPIFCKSAKRPPAVPVTARSSKPSWLKSMAEAPHEFCQARAASPFSETSSNPFPPLFRRRRFGPADSHAARVIYRSVNPSLSKSAATHPGGVFEMSDSASSSCRTYPFPFSNTYSSGFAYTPWATKSTKLSPL